MKKVDSYLLLGGFSIFVLILAATINTQQVWHRRIGYAILMLCGALVYFLMNKLRLTSESFRASQALAKNAFDNTALGMCIVTLEYKYIAINKAYCQIVGYSKEELLSMTHKNFAHPEDRHLDEPYIKELLEGKINSFNSSKRYIHKLGHIVWGQATVSLFRDDKGNHKGFITQIQDITLLVQTQERLKSLARIDYLTDCLNRRAFIEKFSEEMARSKRERNPISVILIDLDFFKKINDTHGHLAGDYVLQQFSVLLSENCRPYDFIGRYGGEEFIIGLPNTDSHEALSIAERIRGNIETSHLTYNDCPLINVTASFGIATLDYDRIEDIDSIISRADKALYQAKIRRNAVCIA